jgi:hypothetical protein
VLKVAFFKPTGHGIHRKAWHGHYITVENLQQVALMTAQESQQQKLPEYQIHPNSVLFSSKSNGKMKPEW